MATYNYSSFQVFAVIPFDPYADVLDFTGSSISSFADLRLVEDSDHGELIFLSDATFLFLQIEEPLRLNLANFDLPDDGLILLGDNSTAWRDDHLANTLIGGAGSDFIAGFDGNDSIDAGAGNDFLYMFTGESNGGNFARFGADTINGGAGFDIIRFPDVEIFNPFSFQAITGSLDGTLSVGSIGSVSIAGGSIEGFVGGEGNDNVSGTTADNYLNGAGGNDTLTGLGGNDTVFGSWGNDSVDGGGDNDFLRGGFGNDTVQGGAGNDTIRGIGLNGESIDGGTGTDQLEVGFGISMFGRTSNLEGLTLISSVGPAGDQAFLDRLFSGNTVIDVSTVHIAFLEGDSGANVITGNSAVNAFSGGPGNDTFVGGGGFDVALYDGEDAGLVVTGGITATLTAGGGGTVTSSQGIDVLQGVRGVQGGEFNDSMSATGSDANWLIGGSGNDTLSAGDGNDTVTGQSGNDSLVGGAGEDMVSFHDSETGIVVDLSLNTVSNDGRDNSTLGGFQAGSDTLVSIEHVAGDIFNDNITGSTGANRLWGGGGNDTLVGGGGNDSIDGGDGTFDFADFSAVTENMSVTYADGTFSYGTTAGTITGIEALRAGSGHDTLEGGNADFVRSIYFWQSGSEQFEGGAGNDSIDGVHTGDGYVAIARYNNSTGAVTVNLGTGLATGDAGNDTLANIDGVFGGSGDDSLVGGSSSTNLDGDLFEFFSGGAGNDTIDGAGGIDRIDYHVNPGAVTIDMSTGLTTGAQGNDSFSNIEGVRGSSGADNILGDSEDNFFEGMQGADTIDGNGGFDLVRYDRSFGGVIVNLGNNSINAFGTVVNADNARDGFDSDGNSSNGIQGFIDSLSGISGAVGSDFSDYFAGSATEANYFDGKGGARQDSLTFPHSDVVDYGQDSFAGALTLDLEAGTASIAGGAVDTLVNIEAVFGTSLADSMLGSNTADEYTGTLIDRTERFRGGTGNDSIDGGGTQWGSFDLVDYSYLGAGNVVQVDLAAGSANVNFTDFDNLANIDGASGTGGNDSLYGGSDSRSFGGTTFELFRGNGGDDWIDGRDGFDVVDYTNASTGITVFLGDGGPGSATDGLGGTDTLFSIEGVRGGQFNDNLFGSDVLREQFEGNAGDDFIDGSGGLDVASYRTSPIAVYVDLGYNFAIDGWGTMDTLADVEGARGSDFDDTLIGGYALGQDFDGWQVFEGAAGNDSIDGADDFVNGAPQYIDNDLDAIEYRNAPGFTIINMSGTTQVVGPHTLAGGSAWDGYGSVDSFADIEIGSGSRFNDTILGGDAAHDRFEGFDGRAGNDSMVGGTGDDWLLYEESPDGVFVDLGGGTANDGWGDVDTFTGMEHVLGSREGNDTLVGNAADNFLHGDDGDDCLRGGAGNDSLDGGDGGDDLTDFNHARDFADYSATANAVNVNLATGRALAGADGEDLLTNIEAARGSAFGDTLTGDAWENLLEGGEGNDSIDGGDGPDWVSHEHDTAGANVNLATQTATDGFGDTDTLRAIEHARGSAFADTLAGSAGDNTLEGLGGNDQISGGGGSDTVSYRGASGAVTINLAAGTVTGAAGDDVLSGIENVIGSRFDDTITGAAIADGERQYLQGNGGADSITGAGSGYSILSFADSSGLVSATTGSGTVTVDGETTTYANINGLVGGTAWDGLQGGIGNDYLEGGFGQDVLIGGGGIDIASWRNAINPVAANISATNLVLTNYVDADGHLHSTQTITSGQALTNANDEGDFNAEFDALNDIEILEGGDFNDTLVGGFATNETLYGGAGNDSLSGSWGPFATSTSSDSLVGGDGADYVHYVFHTGTITVDLATGIVLKSGGGTDQLDSIELVVATNQNDTLTGSNQAYTGRSHDNVFQYLIGNGGNDSITGGSANGQYTGASYQGSASAVVVNLGANSASGGQGTDVLIGIDDALGSNFNDTLIGGSASRGISGQLFESFRGNAGSDSISGGSGEDRVDYRFSTGAVTVNLSSSTLAGAGTASDGQGGTDTLRDIEAVRGSAFGDSLRGGGTQNAGTIYDYEAFEGMEGNDTIDGLGGIDVVSYFTSDAGVSVDLGLGFALDGMGTRDTLFNIEQVVGSDYGDTILGSNAADVREAFRGGAGNDSIDGGAGNDAVYYNASPNAVHVDLSGGFANDGYGDVDTFTNIEGVRGSIFGDVLIGGAGNERFEGIQGDDSIDGGGGDDLLDFHRDGAGVFVDLGNNSSSGALSGNDTFASIEAVRGTLGFNDTIIGSAGNETIDGSGGNDSLDGGAGNDVLSFRSAPSGVHVNLATSVISGAGNDTIAGFEAYEGSDFNDTVTSAASHVLGDGFENLVLLAGVLHIAGTGNTLANVITGNAGHNTLDGGAGNDTLVGGAGNDRYLIDSTGDVIVETLAGAAGGVDEVVLAAGFGPAPFVAPGGALAAEDPPVEIQFTLGLNLENVTVAGSTTVARLTANAANNFLVGGVHNDTLDGGAGNDTLQGLEGIDSMAGGTGNDTYFIRQVGELVTEAAAGGTADLVISSIAIYNLRDNFENLTLAGSATTGIGNALANYIKGNELDNSLLGGLGNDTLEGGGGSDRLIGGAGSDSYIIDGGDVIIELGGSAADQAKVKTSVNLGASAGIEAAAAEAGRYGVDITGNKQGNKISGNETNNVLNGGKGATGDTLDGGGGNDIYVINSVLDKVTDTEGVGDAIQTDFNMSLVPFATVENLYFVGSANTVGVGNAAANLLRGNTGHNLLSGMDNADDLEGGAGNDTLDGGKGADRLYGGAGDDTYVLDDAGDRFFESARVELVSTAAGTDTPAFGFEPATVLSGDGRYLLFYSEANGLVAGDTNGQGDSFVRDMLTGTLTRVSVGATGQQLATDVLHSAINPGGRFVAFTTTDMLLPGDTLAGQSDVYLRDWNPGAGKTPTTTLLSRGTDGNAANGASVMSDLSSDARFVVISSVATNLVADNPDTGVNEALDTGGFRDIFVIDRVANTLVRASVSHDGSGADADSDVGVSISANGLYVAFSTAAANLLADDTATGGNDESDNNGLKDVYLRDLGGLVTERISVALGDGEADGQSGNARLSLDGRYVAFESAATNLVAGDAGGFTDIFVRDRQSGTTTRVSTDSMGGAANGASSVAGISGDGRYVVFQSDASNLVAGDGNGVADVFVKDLQTGAIARVSVSADGLASGGASPDISEDGRYIVFTSTAGLVSGDTNGLADVYRIANPLIMGQGGVDTLRSPFAIDLQANPEFENAVLTGTAAVAATGNDLGNVLDGSLNTAANVLTGGLGNDTYVAGAGDSIVEALNQGTDTVISTVNFSLAALPNVENLTLAGTAASATGNAASNSITGNAANNTIDGGAGPGTDTLAGGAGNDLYIAEAGDSIVELDGGGTNDTVQITGSDFDLGTSTGVENVVLLGNGGFSATGNAAANKLTGDNSANTLTGGLGNDTLVGGGGNDTYVLDVPTDVVTEAGTDTGDTVIAPFSYVLGATLEHLVLLGAENLAGTGNAAANSITGNTGNNLLDGKAGADSLAGGAGNDTFMVDNLGDLALENADEGTDTVLSSVNHTLGGGLEHLTLTGTAAAGAGNALDNAVTGNAAANSLSGGDGNDTLTGGAGADSMNGGIGDDLYFVDALGDSITGDAAGTDRVMASVNHVLAAGIEHLVLTGTAASGTGNAGDNRITGNAAANTLAGGAGNDTLAGGAGSDVYVADGDDEIVELAGAGTDLVRAAGSLSIEDWANVENLALTVTMGGALTGNAANNSILGNAGHDTLDGGLGNDTLAGGLGNDRYVVNATGDVLNDTGGTDTVESTISLVLGAAFEHLALAGADDINGTGNAAANSIAGNAGNNILFGGAGNDTLDGGGGEFDVADYAGTAAVNVNLATGAVTGAAGSDSIAGGIEGVRGSTAADTLTGSGAGSFVDYSNAAAAVSVNLDTNAVSGGGGSDAISGFTGVRGSNAGNDTLTGGGGDNFFFATPGDVVTGGGGNDTIYSAQDFTLPGSVQTLVLIGAADASATGNSGDNSLAGNAGGNTLRGGAGNDTMDGGAGADVADFSTAPGAVTVNLATGSASGDGDDSLAGFEGVRGGSGNDSLAGSAAQDEFVDYSGATAVTLDLGEGVGSATRGGETDALSGFEGARGSDAADTMTGNGANNFFYVTAGDVVAGLGGDDTIYSAVSFILPDDVEALVLTGNGAASATGNGLDNFLVGNGAANTLSGAGGNDTLDGGLGNDSLAGGEGNDLYFVNAAGDVISDSGGTLDAVVSEVNLTLAAGLENLTLAGAALAGTGNAADNSITGNANNNTLNGGAGNDTLQGGAGDDTFLVDSAGDVVADDSGLDLVQATLANGAVFTLGEGIENATLLGAGHSGAVGNALDNLLTGNAGHNTLDGGAGNDTLVGGAGNDIYTIDSTGDVVTDSGGTADALRTWFSTTLSGAYAAIEHLVLLGLNLTGIGNNAANSITGGDGEDYLSGGGGNDGNDTLDGGLGDDTLAGNGGNDTYVVDSLVDAILETATGGVDTVRSSISWTLQSNLEHLVLTGTDVAGTGNAANNSILGGAGHDSLDGAAGNDTLAGGTGNDTLDGGAGVDTMAGGDGDDTYYLDLATDKFAELANQGIDTIVSNATTVLSANFENLTLAGTAAVNGTGTAEANVLTGNVAANLLAALAGHDSLAGGGGNDTLDGGAGNDTMAGGLDNDRYLLDSANDQVIEADGEGIDTVLIGATYSLGDHVENLELTGAAAANATGNTLDNLITGNAGVNSITGGDGHDTLNGGAGADTLDGGIGNDVFVFDAADAPYIGGAGEDALRLAGTGQTVNLALLPGRFVDFERIDLTGTGNNTLTLEFLDLMNLSSTSDTLLVDGNYGDVVNSLHNTGDEHWELQGVELIGDVFYISYFHQRPDSGPILTLLVNQEVTQNIS